MLMSLHRDMKMLREFAESIDSVGVVLVRVLDEFDTLIVENRKLEQRFVQALYQVGDLRHELTLLRSQTEQM